MFYEKKCAACGCICNSEEMYQIGEEFYCSDCASVCSECGETELMENMVLINIGTNEQRYICENCLDTNNIIRCRDCNEYFSLNFQWRRYDGESICVYCCDNYGVCDRCDAVVPSDEINYFDQTDEHLCPECTEQYSYDVNNIIEDYYYKPSPIFFGDTTDNCYLGVELEVDNTSENYENEKIYNAAEELTDKYDDRLYLKHDGSLSRGFEIVSHPCTLDYHTLDFEWYEIMDICKTNTLRSHDTDTCGLHIHISRDYFGDTQEIQDLHIAKLMLLISKFYNSHILKFSRRTESELRWCLNPGMEYEVLDNEKTIIDKLKVCKSKGRYQAINLENENTVEFRIFKGTLNYNTFLASLQFVVEISKYAKQTELLDIPTTNWRDIFMLTNYAELKNYLNERGLM